MLHDTQNGTLSEIVAVARHCETVNSNDSYLILVGIETVVCLITTGTLEDSIFDVIFSSAIALHNSTNQFFWYIVVVGKQLLGVLKETVTSIDETGVILVRTNTRGKAYWPVCPVPLPLHKYQVR